jgi:hypothetical protein
MRFIFRIDPPVFLALVCAVAAAAPLDIDLTAPIPSPSADHLHMGASVAPDGRKLAVDSRGVLRDGKPCLPVMGEFHFSRYPETEWRDELLKMKAGGIDIVASYIFWIHHEEEEGTFDWAGRNSLRNFVTLCGQVGMQVVIRGGPWCHGECRNGGLPDWLMKKTATRTDDPAYLKYATRFYREIAGQVKGLLWKDGGPVVGFQIENEYAGSPDHLMKLKAIACEVGIDVPIYTRTGWPDLTGPMPVGEMLPLYGGYADGFWDRALTEMPGDYRNHFFLTTARNDGHIFQDVAKRPAVAVADEAAEARLYPFLACEIGGGMVTSYHRRVRIDPPDVASLAMVKIASGNNLQGYYMYHGGTNPAGKLTTMNESQATQYWNDLPVMSYEFQTPLGEFGQVREHYHMLRRMHLFLRDFGSSLATMPTRLPAKSPTGLTDDDTLRWCARSDGKSGFLFVNNYQRLQPMAARPDVRFALKLAGGSINFPTSPVTVPADSCFFWPFNLAVGGMTLRHATAQPICRVDDGDLTVVVFSATAGVPADFAIVADGATIETARGEQSSADGCLLVRDCKTGTAPAVVLRSAQGKRVALVLLDERSGRRCWKGTVAGRERVVLCDSNVMFDGDTLSLRDERRTPIKVTLLPAPGVLKHDGKLIASEVDGCFHSFIIPAPTTAVVAAPVCEVVATAGPARAVGMGSQGVAEQPSDADFAKAAVWRVRLPAGLDAKRNLLLRIRYTGDVARLYLGKRLLDDQFYNGNVFDLGLARYAPEIANDELLLKILPLRKDAPIYLPKGAWPDFAGGDSKVALDSVELVETIETRIKMAD